jgi:glycerol-3-phosphate dehydrogenase
VDQALALEPGLHPGLRAAVLVPDATMDAMRLPLRFFATARRNGRPLRPFTEVTGLRTAGPAVTGVTLRDHLTGAEGELDADLVVNATGPWCERLAAMAAATVPVQPSPGVLLALVGRLCDLVVNRLHPAGDGDIVVPQRRLSIVGTSAWTVDDPDDLAVPEDHVQAMYRGGARLVPAVASAIERAVWSAARPLIGATGGAGGGGGRELSRTFKCFDHAATDAVEGFVTITGGKATTLRAMAEAALPHPRHRARTPHRLLHREGGMSAPHTVLLEVFRCRPGDAALRYEELRVPAGPAPSRWTPCWPSAAARTPSSPCGIPACTAPAAPAGCGSTAARSWLA